MSAEDQVQELVRKLYEFQDYFIAKNGIDKASEKQDAVRKQLKECLEIMSTLESKCRKTIYLLQYGKALNIIPEYSKECEDYLSKAVKRDPSLIEGWNLLGETFWKKGDIQAAKDCFEGSLKRAKNKVAMRSLSMVLRQLKCNNRKDYIDNVIKSVDFAKGAVELGSNDGMSWYILGNAYLSMFFATDHSAQTLSVALNAYDQAEKVDSNAQYNPDLHFNRAQACRYEESYQKAFKSWQQASALDPTWTDPHSRNEELLKYLQKVTQLVAQRGKIKTKRLHGMVTSIDDKALGPLSPEKLSNKDLKMEKINVSDLEQGRNLEKIVVGKVVCNFADVAKVPFTFAMVDAAGTCCAVTVYNLADGKGVIIGDSVAIPEPYVSKVDFILPDKGKTHCKYTSLRVNNPATLIVNGKKLPDDRVAFVKLSMDAKME